MTAPPDPSELQRVLDSMANGVVRIVDGRIAYANEQAGLILGEPAENLIGRPVDEIIAPEERQRVADRRARRLRGEHVVDSYVVTHIRRDGLRLRIEVEPRATGPNETVTVLRDVTDRVAPSTLIVALAELAEKMHECRTTEELLQHAGVGLRDLGLPCVWARLDGDEAVVEQLHVEPALERSLTEVVGRRLLGLRISLAPDSALGLAVLGRRSVFYDDASPFVARFLEALGRGVRARSPAQTYRLFVAPLFIRDRAWGALAVPSPTMTQEDAAAVSLFAAQISSTLQTISSLADLERANRDMAALHAVAESGRAAPFEAHLPRLCEVAAAATASEIVAVQLLDEQRAELVLVAHHGLRASVPERFLRVAASMPPLGQLLADRKPSVHGPADIARATGDVSDLDGLRQAAVLPLVLQDEVVGVLALGRRDDRPFRPDEVRNAELVAAQLAIQVENARLYAEAHRRVGMLEVLFALGRIASEANEVVVLTERIVILLGEALATDGARLFLAQDGRLALASWRETGESSITLDGLPLDDTSLAGRAALSRRVLVEGERRVTPPPGPPLVVRHELAAPLIAGDRLVGVLSLLRRTDRPFADDEVRLLESAAAQTALAVERARLFEAARRRVDELQQLVDVGRAITASLDLEEILDSTVATLARLVDATVCHVFLLDGKRAFLRGLATSDRHHRDDFRMLRVPMSEPSVAARAVQTRNTVMVADVATSPHVSPALLARFGTRSLVALPLMARDTAIGCVVLADLHAPRVWTEAEIQRATLVCNQLWIAVSNARLYEDLKRSYGDLGRAQEELVKRERLAALGELAAVVAHEVRNPVAVVFNALSALRKILKPTGDAAMLLGIVGEEADRLNRIVGDLLDFARPNEPALAPEPLTGVIRDTLEAATLSQAERAGSIEIETEVAADLPEVRIDARMLRQALLNVVVNAIQAMPRGGTLRVTAEAELRDGRTWARLDVADTGGGIPPEIAGKVFQPFFTTKATGTGLGLAVVKRIMEAHRGDVSVQSRTGRGTTVSLRLPLEEISH